ncbi:sensor histidine kinase [Micromonospora sp. NPDC047730]|uniref:sensor histidine kinase n=1 Tax=Micromonospora sp. NPDC047730 TaxID=3364253 RepID=UPI003713FA23
MPATLSLGRLTGVNPPPLPDIVLALAQTGVALLLGIEYHAQWRPLDLGGAVLVSLASLPTMYRRQAPVTVLVCCLVAWSAFITAGYWPALNPYGCLVALYTVAALRSLRSAVRSAAAISAIWLYAGLLTMHTSGGGWDPISLLSVTAQAVVVTGVIVKFGDNARKLTDRNLRLARMTEQLRWEQAERARRAVVEERVRIARELHDVIAHHTSVISVHAGLASYVLNDDPASARSALDVIADNSREARRELRRMLGLLRVEPGAEMPGAGAPGTRPPGTGAPAAAAVGTRAGGPEEVDPSPPGMARLDELIDRIRVAGVPVEVVTTGTRRPLPSGPDLCAYRVVQESLTNVLKHAGSASVTVALAYRPDRFEIRVTDDGCGAPSGTGDAAPGHGLRGMAERARIYGGTVTAGPRPEGGFEVALTLPYTASAVGV